MLSQAPSSNAPSMPTVVLVHGAFADGSSWNGVIERLQANGVQVVAPANPLRGISIDSAYLASLFSQIPGPVLAVAHSYGGAVITNAASMASNVVGLVYVAAYAPDQGERISDVAHTSKDSVLGPALVQLHYPTGPGGASAVEVTVDPAKFHDVFASDLPVGQAAQMAATQRAFAELSLTEPSGKPAWKSLPSWAVVATGDKVIGTDLVRSMAERAGASITEVAASHVVMISQPQAVTDVILGAVSAIAATDRAEAVA